MNLERRLSLSSEVIAAQEGLLKLKAAFHEVDHQREDAEVYIAALHSLLFGRPKMSLTTEQMYQQIRRNVTPLNVEAIRR